MTTTQREPASNRLGEGYTRGLQPKLTLALSLYAFCNKFEWIGTVLPLPVGADTTTLRRLPRARKAWS